MTISEQSSGGKDSADSPCEGFLEMPYNMTACFFQTALLYLIYHLRCAKISSASADFTEHFTYSVKYSLLRKYSQDELFLANHFSSLYGK